MQLTVLESVSAAVLLVAVEVTDTVDVAIADMPACKLSARVAMTSDDDNLASKDGKTSPLSLPPKSIPSHSAVGDNRDMPVSVQSGRMVIIGMS